MRSCIDRYEPAIGLVATLVPTTSGLERGERMETTRITESLARTASNNDRLPFDVLGLIFHQYSLESTYPKLLKLETILLVCKAWTSAALGHKALWSSFNVSIHTEESLLYWHHRVPLWLSRCSTTCLFDITIVLSLLNLDFSGDEESLRKSLAEIVLNLTGSEGQIARRWRSLCASGSPVLPHVLAPLLSFPTPNMISLEIEGIISPFQCFPEVPVLETLDIQYCALPNYPDLQNITDLTIGAEGRLQFDEEAVSKAQKLTRLSVDCNFTDSPLRGDFPVLEYLHLDAVQDEAFLGSFSAPHLKTLSLCYGDYGSYRFTSKCAGIPFRALKELRLDNYPNPYYDDGDYGVPTIKAIHLILTVATNIQVLRTESQGLVKTVLELLEDLTTLHKHRFTLKYRDCALVLCQGGERLDRIALFRSEAMLEGKEDAVEVDDKEGSHDGDK